MLLERVNSVSADIQLQLSTQLKQIFFMTAA